MTVEIESFGVEFNKNSNTVKLIVVSYILKGLLWPIQALKEFD